MKDLRNYLQEQLIDAQDFTENTFIINNVGKFLLFKSQRIFDNEMNLLIQSIPDDIDFIAYQFGGVYYYTKADEIKDVSLKRLKYVGKAVRQRQENYTHLGLHGSYELLNGSGLYKEYAKKAKFLEHKSLALCEKNTLAGALNFQSAMLDAEIKPIFGEQITVKFSELIKRDIKIFAKNEKGWRNLLRIHSLVNVFNGDETITIEQLKEYADDVVIVLGTDFDWNFFDELDFIKDKYFQLDIAEYKSPKKEIENLRAIRLYFNKYADKIDPVVISDSYYIDKDYAHIRQLLNKVGNLKFENRSDDRYYKSIDQIYEFAKIIKTEKFKKLFDIAVQNTNEIADKCNFIIDTETMKLPEYQLTDDEAKKYKDSEELFYAVIEEGFERKIKGKVEDEQVYRDRLKYEIEVIKNGGFIDYFLILWDIMLYSKRDKILTGVGRGSAGSSLVSYLMDIIHLDPIKYNLLFERFLNPARYSSVPDIDCDFEGLRRDDVKRYMEERFGIHSVASIGSYTTIKVKSGLKDIGRVMDYDHKNINFITKHLGKVMEGDGADIMQLFKAAVNDKTIYDFVTKNVELINNVSIVIKNHRARSIHASGVIIVPHKDKYGNDVEIYDLLPVKKVDGVLLTEWEGIYVDKGKFVKEDILGIAQLDKWSHTLNLIEKQLGEKINIHTDIPIDDPETYRMFSLGLNDDVFQFGSDAQKKYSKEVKPDNIEDLIAMNALYRPGPIESNAHLDFVKIKHGEKEPDIDIGMEDITGPTYGLWVYQEQLMLAYRKLTDCEVAETDAFRKFTAKFGHYRKMGMTLDEADKYYGKFIKGYQKKFGVTKEYANKVWDKIIAFVSYGFNRSHAVAYALTGYYCQYLKVHYPLQFWTTSLQFANDKEIHKRISEINRSGQTVELVPPSINKSRDGFYSDLETHKIYWSISSVKFAGSKAVDAIIEARQKEGEFFSLDDFMAAVPKKAVNKRVIEYLILSGAFDEMYDVYAPKERIEIMKELYKASNAKLKDEYLPTMNPAVKYDYWWLIKQRQACGYGYIHFDKLLRRNKFKGKYVNELDFQNSDVVGKDVVFGGIVEFINKKKTRAGEQFVELKCEVNNEIVFVTIWPDTYEEYKDIIDNSTKKIVLLNGTIDYNNFKKQNVLMTNDRTEIITLKQ